jgi:hypothetical protein
MHKIPPGSSKYAQNPTRIFQKCTKFHQELGSFSWDFGHFWKFLIGFCAFLEVLCGILCLFGSSSWDFVHFWKILVGFCAYLEVPHGILCNLIPRGSSENAQNPMIDFE